MDGDEVDYRDTSKVHGTDRVVVAKESDRNDAVNDTSGAKMGGGILPAIRAAV